LTISYGCVCSICRGRKRAALLYVATYSASCLSKHSPNYWVLLVGRLLGGIATSLLFSAFEAWAVAAHNSSGFPESLLGDLFTKVRRAQPCSSDSRVHDWQLTQLN
jgi:hypothetical protein